MPEVHFKNMGELYDYAIDRSPPDWNENQVRAAVEAILARLARPFMDKDMDWTSFIPVDEAGFIQLLAERREYMGNPPEPEPTGDGLPDVARAAVEVGQALGSHAPCPANLYLVGLKGNDLIVGRPVGGRITRGEALNLAAWLVALADLEGSTFRALHDAICAT